MLNRKLKVLWLGCGTLARDIEECQMQMLAVKPIARWQIWLGKWLGLLMLNAALLALAGGSVYALLQWRASRLPAEQQRVLRNEIFALLNKRPTPRDLRQFCTAMLVRYWVALHA